MINSLTLHRIKTYGYRLTALLCSAFLFCSCLTEEEYDNDPKGNLEALWQIIDEHYCFFEEKSKAFNLDWNEVHERYQKMLSANMNKDQLFDVCNRMLQELHDGHVNLYSSFNTGRNWDWKENYPSNFSDSIQRIYLKNDYSISAGMKYRLLDDNIAYIYCGSFDIGMGSGNLSAIFSRLAIANGLILDIRNNGGGMLSSAQALAECFFNEEVTAGYMTHKTGKGHNDFSAPEALKLKPAEGMRWQKKVVVLTNRSTYSAANTFAMFMTACPNATIMGDQTGGGGGMPFSSELPNGWTVRFSACPMYDVHMNSIEQGIKPTIAVNMSSADINNGKDTMIETARQYLKN